MTDTKQPWDGHTPLPWSRRGFEVEGHDPEDPDMPWVVASTEQGAGYDSCHDEANAALIVERVNKGPAADAMANLLRRARGYVASAFGQSGSDTAYTLLIDIEKALSNYRESVS